MNAHTPTAAFASLATSPQLSSIIAAVQTTRRLVNEAQTESRPAQKAWRDLAEQHELSRDEEREAMESVPVPAILTAPSNSSLARMTLEHFDGTIRETTWDRNATRTLEWSELDKHFAEDPDALATAKDAYNEWMHARSRAVRALTPQAVVDAHRAWEKALRPATAARRRHEVALKELQRFEAATAEDRRVQIEALLADANFGVSKSGALKNFESDDPEGQVILRLMMQAVRAASAELFNGDAITARWNAVREAQSAAA